MYLSERSLVIFLIIIKLDLCVPENSSPGAPNACHRERSLGETGMKEMHALGQ